MFNYATYNGIPIITYVLIGLTTSILGLVTLNPGMLELKEDGTQITISEAIGLDKISNDNKKVTMKIHKDSGDVIDVKLNVRLDVPEEVTFWKNGGILPTAYKEA